jgi:hypothetical protein
LALKDCHGRIKSSKVNAPQPLRGGLAAWLWRRPQRWFLLGIPAGGLIAFIIGIGFAGSFVAGLKFAESDFVLHLVSRDEHALPGINAKRALFESSSAFGELRQLPRAAGVPAGPVAAH